MLTVVIWVRAGNVWVGSGSSGSGSGSGSGGSGGSGGIGLAGFDVYNSSGQRVNQACEPVAGPAQPNHTQRWPRPIRFVDENNQIVSSINAGDTVILDFKANIEAFGRTPNSEEIVPLPGTVRGTPCCRVTSGGEIWYVDTVGLHGGGPLTSPFHLASLAIGTELSLQKEVGPLYENTTFTVDCGVHTPGGGIENRQFTILVE